MSIIIFFISCIQCNSQIINEISPYPLPGIPEWIELYNRDSVELHLYDVIINDNTTRQYIGELQMKSNEYVILTKDTASLKQNIFLNNNCTFIQTTLPVLNNTTDRVILSSKGTILDSLYYSFLKKDRGKSLERNIIYSHDTLSISANPLGNTCGFVNSCTPLNYDIQILKVAEYQDSVLVVIHNFGYQTIKNIDMRLLSKHGEGVFIIDSMLPFEKKYIECSMDELGIIHGYNSIDITLQQADNDPRRYNDSRMFDIYRSLPFKSIRINEIQVINNKYPEYVELLITNKQDNIPTHILEINGKRITINDSLNRRYILLSSDSIQIDERVTNIIVDKTLSINDNGGIIRIIDINNAIIDSVEYTAIIETHADYVNTHSLECIDSTMQLWHPSTDKTGGSPGRENSPIREMHHNKMNITAICPNNRASCRSLMIQHPFLIGIYSCDIFSVSGIFMKNSVKNVLIASEASQEIPFDPMYKDQLLILVHTIKDLYGNEMLFYSTPLFMRN